MPEKTLGELAEYLGATLANGKPDQKVGKLAGLAEAGAGELSFLSNPAYKDLLATTRAEAVVVSREVTDAPTAILRVDNPDMAFGQAALLLNPPPPRAEPGIHPAAVIGKNVKLGEGVWVGPGAVIADGAVVGDRTRIYPQAYVGTESRIGTDCILYPHVTVYHRVTIGDRCIVHAGAVIGSDGFGYAWTGAEYYKIPQVGTVVLEDGVEIGANTTVDRARFGETRIGAGTKLDNLIQIAHNVKVGAMCAFAAQVGIAGSATIGNGVQMGGQAAVVGHIRVGDRITLVGQAAAIKNIPGAETGVDKSELTWVGSPAVPMRDQLKEWQNLKSVARLRKTVKELEARLANVEKRNNDG